MRHVTVNALIVDDGKVLLGLRGTIKGKPLMESGKWSLIGGFFEHGETLEQAIRREIREESGFEVQDLTLFRIKDNPHRKGEDRANVEFVFTAHPAKKIGESDEEVQKLQWFSLDALPPEQTVAFDHYSDLELYANYVKSPQKLPIFGK